MAPRKPNARSQARAISGALEISKKSVARTGLAHSKSKPGSDMGMKTDSDFKAALKKDKGLKRKQKAGRATAAFENKKKKK